jgi:glucose-6-phosphate dehydrogenase assembly protein OpcA
MSTTTPFLEGQGIPVELREIEDVLAKLWGPAALQAGGPEVENPNVTRIVLANLVVESLDRGHEPPGPVLETVISRFPCRAILVRGSESQERRITAEVSAYCRLSAPGLPQVCSERIILHAGPNAVDLLPGAILPLLEADLPLVLWWTSDPRTREPLFGDLADECSRVVLDLPDPGPAAGALRLGLDPALCSCSRDSAWFGLARWRELVAQFFDASCHLESVSRIDSVVVETISSDPAWPPRVAIWLVAWLAGQLGWQPRSQPVNHPVVDSTGKLEANFLAPSGDVAVTVETRPAPTEVAALPQIMGLTITTRKSREGGGGVDRFHLSRLGGSAAIFVEIDAVDTCRLPRLIDAPELDTAHRIAAALESARVDPPFQNALPIALWLLEAAESSHG